MSKKDKTDLMRFYDQFVDSFNTLEKSHQFSEEFYSSFLSGDNTLYQKFIKETKNFDEEWINAVESYVPSINKIIQDPKSTLKTFEEVVAVEKARKTTSQTVKHLSANTHMIREVTGEGEVIPKRVLTTYADLNYGTYENRFIMTLIDRLFIFVKQRYDLIKRNIESHERRRFHMKSQFPVNDTVVDYEVNFLMTDGVEDKKINEYNYKLLDRVEYLNKVVTSLKTSAFMELMKSENKIYPPIMKTNVIQKNVDYRNAYMLWLFMDRYNTLAFTIDVEEKNLTFNKKYYDAINRQVLITYLSIVANQQKNRKIYQTLESRKLRKKSIKIKRTHPDDISLQPYDEEIEDQTLNQYYLEASKQLFEQSLEYHAEHSKTYETTVKRALRDTLNISNALYQSFFELDHDVDIFMAMVKDFDASKELDAAKRRALIAKMIREVKQVDFNDSLRQERRLLDDVIEYSNLLIKEYKEREELLKEEEEHLAELEKIKKLSQEEQRIVRENLKEVQRMKAEVDAHSAQINKEVRSLEVKLQRELDKNLAQHRKVLKEEERKVLADYRRKYEPKKRVTNNKIKREKERLDLRKVSRLKELEQEYAKRIIGDREQLTKEHDEYLDNREQYYIDRLKENEANVEKLSQYQAQYNQELKAFEDELKETLKETTAMFDFELKLIQKEQDIYFKNKYKVDKRLTDQGLEKELAKINNKLEETKKALERKYEKKIQEEQAKLESAHSNTLAKDEQRYKRLLKNNETNLKKLAEIEKAYEKALSKIEGLKDV